MERKVKPKKQIRPSKAFRTKTEDLKSLEAQAKPFFKNVSLLNLSQNNNSHIINNDYSINTNNINLLDNNIN